MKTGKVKLILTVGNAGTGKTSNISNMLDDMNNTDVFLTSPNQTASSRLRDSLNNMDNTRLAKKLQRKTYVNFSSFDEYKATNIIIDEFGELSKIDFESLLFHVRNIKEKDGKDVNIYCYGDSHQLPPINKFGALDAIWMANRHLFNNADDSAYRNWMGQLYSNLLTKNTLNVVEDWNNTVDTIEVRTLYRNYRMERTDWEADDYDEEFYQELRNEHSFTRNYGKHLSKCLNEGWLILSPKYDRIHEANRLLANSGNCKPVNDFPFVDKKDDESDVHLNPYHTNIEDLQNNFPSIPTLDTELAGTEQYEFTCGCVVANVQGMEADRVCFYMGSEPISPMSHDFYTINNLHTGLTRGRKDWLYLGNIEDYDTMLNTPRRDARKQLELYSNNRALENMVKNACTNYFGETDLNPYQDYLMELYNLNTLGEHVEKWSKENFAIRLRDYLENNGNLPSHLRWAKYIINQSQANGRKIGGQNRKGTGRLQQQIENTLSDDVGKFKILKNDAFNLSQREFKKEHDCDRNNVRHIIEEIETTN